MSLASRIERGGNFGNEETEKTMEEVLLFL